MSISPSKQLSIMEKLFTDQQQREEEGLRQLQEEAARRKAEEAAEQPAEGGQAQPDAAQG